MNPDSAVTRSSESVGVGSAISRREDASLLTGGARYTDDVSEPGMAHLAILRSRFGHARIHDIDLEAAKEDPAVIDAFSAEDIVQSGVPGEIRGGLPLLTSDDPAVRVETRRELTRPSRPLLARSKVRYAGEPVAVVVATDRYAAHDALDKIHVEYDRVDAVVSPESARTEDAPTIFDGIPNNTAYDWELGDSTSIERVFRDAPHTVSVRRPRQRLVPNPMEPRAAVASFDAGSERLSVQMGTQVPHSHRRLLSGALGIPEERIQVSAPAVGGGFGAKSKFYAGEVLAAWCSMQVGRPVKWIATRTEAFLADVHGRGHDARGELAVDDDGTFLGLRVRSVRDLGAYVSRATPMISTGSYATLLSGQYQIPEIYCRVTGVFTNTAPTDAYRGSDRPEASFLVERLVREAARELDMDPVELRRRNLIPPDEFPYRTPVLSTYDSGEYEAALDRALKHVDYEQVRERQAALREEGRYLGIGLGCFAEPAGSPPPSGNGPAPTETSRVEFTPTGSVTAYCGTADQGQGHRTTYAQLLADELGVPYDDIEVREGDTEHLPHGTGTYGSRSVIMGGNSLATSAQKTVEQARRIAAYQLEVPVEDVALDDGRFSVVGAPDRSIDIQTIAKRAYADDNLPDGVEPRLGASTSYPSDGLTWSYGAHVAVVEVTPETGDIEVQRYVAVDDCGVQINPELVEGQVVGATVQGIGEALYEGAVYDESGSLLTGSLQDYSLPKITMVPDITTDSTVTPSPFNPLGVKGTGESGTVGGPPTIVNAVVDALEPFGICRLDMPISPEQVWRAVHGGTDE